jgi:hypothetical protein
MFHYTLKENYDALFGSIIVQALGWDYDFYLSQKGTVTEFIKKMFKKRADLYQLPCLAKQIFCSWTNSHYIVPRQIETAGCGDRYNLQRATVNLGKVIQDTSNINGCLFIWEYALPDKALPSLSSMIKDPGEQFKQVVCEQRWLW